MIAVISSPSESEFGKVARSDDYAALLVCNVHKDLSTLPRL